ncbi:MAG: PH domain-containing protein [Verrucomicrobia bacterium]|nr:PH domain-containing protein [Verrucomicrobiota bacterium]
MRSTLTSAIESGLSSGERLLWSGQPRVGIRLRPSDAFVIPFSLLWCGFAIFWEFGAVTSGAPFFFRLWGVPFVLVGLHMVFGRFFVDARMRERTFYGVTTERIIIVSGLFSQQTKSLQLRTVSDISLTERSDGSGTITFGPQHPMMQRMPAGWPGAGQYAAPAFDMIEGAKEVYDIIRQAQKASA